MTLYSDLPGRRAGQVVADLFVLAWVTLWMYAGRKVYDATLALRGPADQLRENGDSLHQSMASAADTVAGIPLVGDDLRGAFDQASGAGTSMSQAGSDMATAVERLSVALGLTTALLPILVVVTVWGLLRWRFVRRATAARRFLDARADLDLFALRAMARQPFHRLARISDDPAGAWRRGDPRVVQDLAALEVHRCGLRMPSALGRDPGGPW